MSVGANLMGAIGAVTEPITFLLLVTGVLIRIIMGSLPGMTATMTVAVLVSFTFGMDPVPGMMLLLGIYGGALYAGSIGNPHPDSGDTERRRHRLRRVPHWRSRARPGEPSLSRRSRPSSAAS